MMANMTTKINLWEAPSYRYPSIIFMTVVKDRAISIFYAKQRPVSSSFDCMNFHLICYFLRATDRYKVCYLCTSTNANFSVPLSSKCTEKVTNWYHQLRDLPLRWSQLNTTSSKRDTHYLLFQFRQYLFHLHNNRRRGRVENYTWLAGYAGIIELCW